jgi:hypothetical protein
MLVSSLTKAKLFLFLPLLSSSPSSRDRLPYRCGTVFGGSLFSHDDTYSLEIK